MLDTIARMPKTDDLIFNQRIHSTHDGNPFFPAPHPKVSTLFLFFFLCI